VTLSNGAELFSSPIWVTRTSGCSDTTAPTATVTAPTATTVTGTVSVTASGTDNVAVTGMTLRIDGTQVASSTSGAVSHSWNTTGLAAGSSHTIVATSTDACGNTTTSATKTVTIGSTCTDTTLPTATVTAPTASTVTGTVSVTASGTDNVAVTGMTLRIDGTQVATSASGSISYSWNTSALTAGSSHTIIATATDACGNTRTSTTKTVTIGSSCTDTTLPNVSVTAPANGATVTGTVSVTVAGTDNVAVTGMTLRVDGTQVATSTTGSLTYSWNTTALTAGSSHTLVATATDACGNVRTSSTITVTKATTTFTNPVLNPGFESGSTSWTQTGTYEQIVGSGTASNNTTVNPQAGTKMAWMAGYDSGDDYLPELHRSQCRGNVNLSFWYRIITTDGTTTAYDNFYLDVYNSTGTTRLGTLVTMSNKNANSAWTQRTLLSLNTWKGQTIRLRFHATNDSSNPTDFMIDGINVTNP
jgi:hypothetical protein